MWTDKKGEDGMGLRGRKMAEESIPLAVYQMIYIVPCVVKR